MSAHSDAIDFREAVFERLRRLTPTTRRELIDHVTETIGEACSRRVERACVWLESIGAARRTPDGWLRAPRGDVAFGSWLSAELARRLGGRRRHRARAPEQAVP